MRVYCCCPNNVKVSTVILFTAIQHQEEDECFFFTFTHQIIIRRHTSNKDRQPNGQNEKTENDKPWSPKHYTED
jgi:hypothetical protein